MILRGVALRGKTKRGWVKEENLAGGGGVR
jgi:hypothetical protein